MKPFIPYSLLAAFAACGLASAQTAVTTPVGYVSLGNTASGAPNLPAETDIFVSTPLERAVEWSGTVASVDTVSGEITLAGTPSPAFTAGQWLPSVTANPSDLDPYIIKIEGVIEDLVEGSAASGLVAVITANTANSVTVGLQPGDNLDDVEVGDKISIRRAVTPHSFFAGNTLPSGVQILTFEGVSGTDVSFSGSASYDAVGGTWTDDFFGADLTHSVLYPSEMFILRNPTLTDIDELVVTGTVSTSSQRSVVTVVDGTQGQDIPVSYFSPVGELIADASFPGLTDGDQLLVYDNTASGLDKSFSASYSFSGGVWVDDFFGGDTSTLSLEGGVSYFIRRQVGATDGDLIWTDTPSYVPTLD